VPLAHSVRCRMVFSTEKEELDYWKAQARTLKGLLQDKEAEFEEFREESKIYEKELEDENERYVVEKEELDKKNKRVSEENEQLKVCQRGPDASCVR
jgi:predicted type IV restriction endonuclease